MKLEIYTAFVNAGRSPDVAKAVVNSISREIDKQCSLHSQQMAARGDVEGVRNEIAELCGANKADIAEAKFEIIKWTIGGMFAAVGLFATIIKIWH